eukprot:5115833-Lingulodinium_polyedra.AAC.1
MKSLARKCKSSARHVIDWAFTCALLLGQKQSDAIQAVLALSADWSRGFLVVQLMWDETKFSIVPTRSGIKKATKVSTLAAHGRFLWSTDGTDVAEDEVIVRPIAMESTKAAHMWSAFEHALPEALLRLLRGDTGDFNSSPPAWCPSIPVVTTTAQT